MIDLHCHILPAADDGAIDVGDSLGMARPAAADGIAAVCATPHIRYDHDVRIAELGSRAGQLVRAVREAGLPVTILPGGEVSETAADGLSDEELRAVARAAAGGARRPCGDVAAQHPVRLELSLGGGGRWILLEPRPGPLSDSLTAAVDQLVRRGFSPLIAHPERHRAADLTERLAEAVRRGALVQATAALLEHGGRLSGAFATLRAAGIPAARIRWMAEEAPAAIVAGAPVTPP